MQTHIVVNKVLYRYYRDLHIDVVHDPSITVHIVQLGNVMYVHMYVCSMVTIRFV